VWGRAITFEGACSLIHTILQGTARQDIVTNLSISNDMRRALLGLRESMQVHVWKVGGDTINLAGAIEQYDTLTRREGFHVLHDWDGKADRVNAQTIPVDVLNFLVDQRGADRPDRTALAILADYYFLNVLALLSLRVWDEGRPDEHLDRLQQLLDALQGPNGSGQRFVQDSETLILIATSHYELDEQGFDTLLAKARSLDRSHRTRLALVHAASLGCHLRFGFEATCGRDTVLLRGDNVADYPWLSFALVTLMREYARMHDEGVQVVERDRLVEGLLNGLSPDARAFISDYPPASLSACEAERREFRERFRTHREDLQEGFNRHRPSEQVYSPLSFLFNFSHNILKGTVIDALLRGEAWNLTFNDLLTALPAGDPKAELRETLAHTLMGYARASPDRIRGRLLPVIIYDPSLGREAFSVMMRKIRD
jgi:hypothetical protein